MRLPENKLLRNTLQWFAGAAMGSVIMFAFRRGSTVEDHVNNFFADLIMPYFFGAFASQNVIIWIAASVSGIMYALSVTNLNAINTRVAKISLILILTLSLFTIWIEPWTSVTGGAAQVTMLLVGIPTGIVDLCISVIWSIVVLRACFAIGREQLVACATNAEQAGASSLRPWFLLLAIIGSLILFMLVAAFLGVVLWTQKSI